MAEALSRGGLAGLALALVLLAGACVPGAAPASPTAVGVATGEPTATLPPRPTAVATAIPSVIPTVTPVATSQQLSGTVKVVSSFPRSGKLKGVTDSMVNSLKMAVEDSGGKVGNASIVFVDMDDATAARDSWDAAREADNANRAVADRDVLLYVGPFDSIAAKVSIPILNRAGLAMISPASTYAGLTKSVDGMSQADEPGVYYPSKVRNYFRVVPTDEVQGAVGAAWGKELGVRKAYVLDDQDDSVLYGHGVAVAFTAAARQLGLEILGGPEGVDPRANDYRPHAQRIKSTGAELVYYGGIAQNNAGRLWQDLRAAMPDVKLMGPDGIFDNAFLQTAGQAAEGSYITLGMLQHDQLKGKGAEFVKRYRDKYGQDPDPYAAYTYEAAAVGLKAVEECGKKDRKCVVDALARIRSYDGVLGTWGFTETGDTTLTSTSGYTVNKGKFQFTKLLQLAR